MNAPDEKGKKNWFVNTGDRFGAGGRFVAGDLEKKVIPDPKVGEKDVSELKVEDTLRKTTFTLVNGADTNLPDYEAEFESRLKFVDRAKAMKGGNFRFTHWPDTTYKVIDIQEDNAVISPLNSNGELGKEIIIKKG